MNMQALEELCTVPARCDRSRSRSRPAGTTHAPPGRTARPGVADAGRSAPAHRSREAGVGIRTEVRRHQRGDALAQRLGNDLLVRMIVRQLLAKGASARQATRDGTTPLHAAAAGCFDGTMRDLIKAGARVRVRLSMVAESQRTLMALVDPLPAG